MSNSVLANGKCQLRILIVADGAIHFGSQATGGFGLSEFIAALKEPVRPWEDLLITTALRGDDDDGCTPNTNFKFDSGSFNIGTYDEVWLFGHANEDDVDQFLKPSELRSLYDFMNQGGGVFATGDHESLGFPLCGKIPRVLSMRKWQFANATAELKAPGRIDDTRIDTLREGLTAGFQLTDESDRLPQEIRPKFYMSACATVSYPHPLLADRDLAITVLPDHMHEGECLLPKDLTNSFNFDGGESFDEYPLWPNSAEHSRPDLVAISTSAGGGFTELSDTYPPVEPRSFYAIVAYDGHLVENPAGGGVRPGRVVVDSSFHHFLDFNLKGFRNTDGTPTQDYVAFKKYFRNIVSWLYPARRRRQYYMSLLLQVRFSGALMAELPTTTTFSLEEILRAGSLTRRAIATVLSEGEAVACALALLATVPVELSDHVERLINPWLPKQLKPQTGNAVLNTDFFLHSILGIAILNLTALPPDAFKAAEGLAPVEQLEAVLSPRIAETLKTKLGSLVEVVRLSQIALENF